MDVIAQDSRLGSAAQAFLSRGGKMLIDGRLCDAESGKTIPVYNPATGQIVMSVAEADRADVNRAVAAARRTFDDGSWASVTHSKRGQLLWRLADLLERDADEFAELESLDNGKPKSVALAADVPLAADPFWYMAGWATVPRSRRRCRTCPTRSSMRTRRVSRSASPGRSSPRTARS